MILQTMPCKVIPKIGKGTHTLLLQSHAHIVGHIFDPGHKHGVTGCCKLSAYCMDPNDDPIAEQIQSRQPCPIAPNEDDV